MDGDGQHPPELIPDLLKLFENGFDLVLTQRIGDGKVGFFKKLTSKIFYKLINFLGETELTPASADFRLQSRKVVLAIREMREQHRFLRGMVAWMGFSTSILPFSPPARIGGESKYSVAKMINLARDAIFSFSLVPMRLSIVTGIFFFLVAFVQAIYVLSFWVTGNQNKLAPGWSSLLFIILIIGGLLFVQVGLIGYYIGFIFQEVKNRPLYLVREFINKENVNNSFSRKENTDQEKSISRNTRE
jgi:polyisoprenyl-phosphate glycosyltransferase